MGPLFGPITDAVGFSERDGLTHLEIQRRLREKIIELIGAFNNLNNHVRTSENALDTAYRTDMDALTAKAQDAADSAAAAIEAATGAINASDAHVAELIGTTPANETTTALSDFLTSLLTGDNSATDAIATLVEELFTGETSATLATLAGVFGKLSAVGWYAADHGVVGDGVTDDGPALNTFLNLAAAAGVPAILNADSVVLTNSPIMVPSNSRFNLNGATIKAGPTLGASQRVISIINKTNVQVYGGTIDGNLAAFATATEFRHGIHIGGSTDVAIWNMKSHHNKGDGIFVGDQEFGVSSRISIANTVCDSNYRQGMSITSVRGMTVTACDFINTAGTAPQAGVDVEPDQATDIIEGLRFVGCTMSGNAGAGLQILRQPAATTDQGDISVTDCSLVQNATEGLYTINARGVLVSGGNISYNASHGVLIAGTYGSKDISLTNVCVRKNGLDGVQVNGIFTNLRLMGLAVTDNSQTTALGASGISVTPLAGPSTGLTVIGCNSSGSRQWAGLRVGANVNGAVLVGNSLDGNGSGPSDYLDTASARVVITGKTNDSAQMVGPFTTAAPLAGGGSAPPATPEGYLSIMVNGNLYQVPCYHALV